MSKKHYIFWHASTHLIPNPSLDLSGTWTRDQVSERAESTRSWMHGCQVTVGLFSSACPGNHASTWACQRGYMFWQGCSAEQTRSYVTQTDPHHDHDPAYMCQCTHQWAIYCDGWFGGRWPCRDQTYSTSFWSCVFILHYSHVLLDTWTFLCGPLFLTMFSSRCTGLFNIN